MATLKKTPLDIDLIVHLLIKDDLVNCQLIYGLHRLNVNAEQYLLHLSETIFLVLGYDPEEIPEPLWDAYYDLTMEKSSISPLEQEKSLD